MTALAAKVLGGLPEPTTSGTANNYVILQEFTNDTDKMGGKLDFRDLDAHVHDVSVSSNHGTTRRFTTLPMALRGRSSTKRNTSGTL